MIPFTILDAITILIAVNMINPFSCIWDPVEGPCTWVGRELKSTLYCDSTLYLGGEGTLYLIRESNLVQVKGLATQHNLFYWIKCEQSDLRYSLLATPANTFVP